jgi:hypothetical protein
MSNRAKDAEVAERVMGWRRIEWEGGTTPMGRSSKNVLSLVLEEVPHYSTDIAAAWQVVEHLFTRGLRLSLNAFGGDPWWAEFADEGYEHGAQAPADTAPLAICRAALAAVAGSPAEP